MDPSIQVRWHVLDDWMTMLWIYENKILENMEIKKTEETGQFLKARGIPHLQMTLCPIWSSYVQMLSISDRVRSRFWQIVYAQRYSE